MSTVSGSRAPHTHAPSVQNLPVVWKTGSSCPESSGSAPGHPSPVGRPISAPARRSRCFGASFTTTLGRSYLRRHSRANDGLAAADQPPPPDVPWPQPGAHFELVGLQGRVHTTMLGACRLVGIARSGCPSHTALLVRAAPSAQRRSFWAPATMLCGYRRVGRVHSDSEDRRRQMTRRSWFAQRPPTVRHPLQRRRPFSPLAHPFRLAAPCCPPGSLSASSFHLNAVGRLAGARLAGCSFPLHVLWWFE